MNLRQKVSLIFLFLGFLFSSIFRIRFNLSNGFEFHSFWITWIPSIFDFALLSSSEHALTTTLGGYLFFALSGFLMLNPIKTFKNKNTMHTAFLGLSVLALGFELISLGQDLFTSYYGQHLRIGLILFVLGMIVFYRIYHSSKIIGVLHND